MALPNLQNYLNTNIETIFSKNSIILSKILKVIKQRFKVSIKDLVLSQEITEPEFTKREINKINSILDLHSLRVGLTQQQLDAYTACYNTNLSTILLNKIAQDKGFPKSLCKKLTENRIITYLDLFLNAEEELRSNYRLSDEEISEIKKWAEELGLICGISIEYIVNYCKQEKKWGNYGLTTQGEIRRRVSGIDELTKKLAHETEVLQLLIAHKEKGLPNGIEQVGLRRLLARTEKKQ